MTAQSQQDQIDDLFARAIELPRDERQAFLIAAAAGDADVLAAVQKLVIAHDKAVQSTDFLRSLPSDARLFADPLQPHHPLVGQRIGPYEVKRWLGGGGFGNVYLAFRSDDYKQKVAIKVLRSDIDVDDRILARFDLERQLLADLQHEHIARLLYGGTLDTGRPYIVMEYVKGKPITEYCDSKKLPIAERLAIFRQVCEAVAYAHRYSAIHRDIKPGNILVTDDGMVKLLDFGIAKMVDPISQRRMVTISEGGMPLTPEYASPEQVRGDGISTASDVYSLGVVLYELLTGRRPYDFRRYTAAEIERVICEEEPRKPSRVVLESLRVRRDDGIDDVRSAEIFATPRSTNPHRLHRTLRGDLEQIVLMALRKEPLRRFQSVEALIQDLERFNQGQTIMARPVGRTERLWRWIKRRPAAAALVALVCAIVLVAPIIAVQQTSLRLRAVSANEQLTVQVASNLFQRANSEYFSGRPLEGITLLAGAYETAPRDCGMRSLAANIMAGWSATTQRPLLHKANVCCAQFSPDGMTAVTGSYDSTAQLWSVQSGAPIGDPMKHADWVTAVAFSPGGHRVATGSKDGTARIWDATSGRPTAPPLRHHASVKIVKYSPNGKMLLTGSSDKTAQLWDAETGQALGEPMRHSDAVWDADFSPDGTTIATGSKDKTIRLWNSATASSAGEPFRLNSPVRRLAFSPNGRKLVGGTTDGSVQFWDLNSHGMIGRRMQHERVINQLVFSPDGKQLLTASGDRTAKLWDAETGELVGKPMKHDAEVLNAAFDRSGRLAITATRKGQVFFWNSSDAEPVGAPLIHEGSVHALAISPNGCTAITGTGSGYAYLWEISRPALVKHGESVDQLDIDSLGRTLLTVSGRSAKFWDVESGISNGIEINQDSTITAVAYNPTGKTILTAGDGLFLWDALTGKLIRKASHKWTRSKLAFSLDGHIAATTDGNELQLWDAASLQARGTPLKSSEYIITIAFSPDGRLVVAGTDTGNAHIWNVETGAPSPWSFAHNASVLSLALSPDGHKMLSGSYDQKARLWDLDTGKLLFEPLRNGGPVNFVEFSPNGQTALTGSVGDNRIRLWSTSSGKLLGEPIQLPDWLSMVKFAENGRLIVTASVSNRSVQLWDTSSAAPAGKFTIYDARIHSIVVTPNGKTIIVGLSDGTVRRLEIPTANFDNFASLKNWAKARTGFALNVEGFVQPISQDSWFSLWKAGIR